MTHRKSYTKMCKQLVIEIALNLWRSTAVRVWAYVETLDSVRFGMKGSSSERGDEQNGSGNWACRRTLHHEDVAGVAVGLEEALVQHHAPVRL